MMSASVDRPEVMRSKTLDRACVGRNAGYLEGLKSSETVHRDGGRVGRGSGGGVDSGVGRENLGFVDPREGRAGGEDRDKETTEGETEVGAHLSRNCSESKWALRVMASGFSATASMMGLRIGLMTALVRDSGSFSQSKRAPSASGVGMVAGSLM